CDLENRSGYKWLRYRRGNFLWEGIRNEIKYVFGGEKVIEVRLVCLTEILKVRPPLCHVRSRVIHNNTLIIGIHRVIRYRNAHYAPNELHEGAKITENAAYCSDTQPFVVEPLPKFSDLDDHVEFVAIEFGENAISIRFFTAVYIGSAKAPSGVGFRHLYAVSVVQR